MNSPPTQSVASGAGHQNSFFVQSGSSPPPRPAKAIQREADFDGVAGLCDRELVALAIGRCRDAQRIATALVDDHGLVGLAALFPADLRRLGVHAAGALQLVAAFELARRVVRVQRRERPSLRTPEAVVQVLSDLSLLDHEQLWLLPLDPHSRLIDQPRVVSIGDVDGTDAGPRKFFRLALAAGATSAIACHNHPSGRVEPSAADRCVTARLVAAGRLVDIQLADHVVVGQGGAFCSLRRESPSLFR